MLVTTKRNHLNTIEQGTGELTILFMHYFGGSSKEWLPVLNQLAPDYHCVAVDLRGCGDSDAPPTGYSVDDLADDLAKLIDEKALRRYVVVGHSMSGKIALALAARQPVGLQSLILVAPSPPTPEPITPEDRQHLLATYGVRQAAEETFQKITVRPLSEAVRAQVIEDNLRTSKPAWDAWLTLGSKENIADRMDHIVVPVAIMAGEDDGALAFKVQEQDVMPYLKNGRLTPVPQAGHLLPLEVPDELAFFIRQQIHALQLA